MWCNEQQRKYYQTLQLIFILYDFICLVIEGGRDVRALREYVAAQIEEEAQKPHRLKPWPDLQPAE